MSINIFFLLRTCDSVIFNTFHAGEEVSNIIIEKK